MSTLGRRRLNQLCHIWQRWRVRVHKGGIGPDIRYMYRHQCMPKLKTNFIPELSDSKGKSMWSLERIQSLSVKRLLLSLFQGPAINATFLSTVLLSSNPFNHGCGALLCFRGTVWQSLSQSYRVKNKISAPYICYIIWYTIQINILYSLLSEITFLLLFKINQNESNIWNVFSRM